MRVATWNVEWADPDTSRGSRARAALASLEASIIVLTEGCRELLPPGNTTDGGSDWGYPLTDKRRRKVILWSKHPVTDLEYPLSGEFPSGRLVVARVGDPSMRITVVAVCIPWRDAHVRTGRKNRKPWEDHLTFIQALTEILPTLEMPLIVAGDFNQRIPRGNQPNNVSSALSVALEGLNVATDLPLHHPLIDHIALSKDLAHSAVEIIPDSDELGRLSDHRGAVTDVFAR
jgi:endonuclease/exonuclease/phosphatase family metal-dependent hydrolase